MKRILIADDMADVRRLVRLILEPLDVQLLEAVSGRQALEQARAARPDLIILDVVLPQHDGYEVCRALRADPVLSSIPILLLSARAGRADEELGRAAGADAYMVKPFRPQDLFRRVQQTLQPRQLVEEAS